MSMPWPTSPLAAAARAFDLLTCPPAPLAFDARGVAGLPQRILPLDELRDALIKDSTPKPVRDVVWRELVTRARRDGPACVGIAMPGLRAQAGLLARRWHGDIQDLDAELVAGFVQRLTTVDVEAPRVAGRLIDAGARAAKRARQAEVEASAIHAGGAWSRAPREPWNHPDWVLTRAVAAAVIDPEEHLLIGATRLEDVALQVVADKLGISAALAASWRRKAERRLVTAIADGELDWVDMRSRAQRETAARRLNGGGRTASATVHDQFPSRSGAVRSRPHPDPGSGMAAA